MKWLIDLITALFGALLNRKPDIVQESEKAGAAEQALTDVETGDAQVTQAIQAGDAADRAAATDPDSLRAPDPNSRD